MRGMKALLAALALAGVLTAAGCGGEESHDYGPGIVTALPEYQLPSNSGVLLVFTEEMNLNVFTGELLPSWTNQTANSVQGSFEEIAVYRVPQRHFIYASSNYWCAVYWTPKEPLPLGAACLRIEGFNFPSEDEDAQRLTASIETVVEGPDNEPPHFLGAHFFQKKRTTSLIELMVELRFSEMVLWDRMEAQYGAEHDDSASDLEPLPILDLDTDESENGEAIFHAVVSDLEEKTPYRVVVRGIYDLAKNRGADASIRIQYEP